MIEGSPWSFNRKALLLSRMKEGENPRSIELKSIDLWVQIHDLIPGCMSEKVIIEVGYQLAEYVSSCPNNFKGIWKEYMRVRVTMDITKPLKRRMKVRKSGNEWSWITFKYENVPTFCFICGIMGHPDKFCGRLFDTPEGDIVKPYGSWMRAPLRRQTRMVGEKWLRNETGEIQASSGEGSQKWMIEEAGPNFSERGFFGGKYGEGIVKNHANGEISGKPNKSYQNLGANTEVRVSKGVTILENKKRRTDMGFGNVMGLNTEIGGESEEETIEKMDQDINVDPKNVFVAGSESRARLSP